jgi:hypothetical protein
METEDVGGVPLGTGQIHLRSSKMTPLRVTSSFDTAFLKGILSHSWPIRGTSFRPARSERFQVFPERNWRLPIYPVQHPPRPRSADSAVPPRKGAPVAPSIGSSHPGNPWEPSNPLGSGFPAADADGAPSCCGLMRLAFPFQSPRPGRPDPPPWHSLEGRILVGNQNSQQAEGNPVTRCGKERARWFPSSKAAVPCNHLTLACEATAPT